MEILKQEVLWDQSQLLIAPMNFDLSLILHYILALMIFSMNTEKKIT